MSTRKSQCLGLLRTLFLGLGLLELALPTLGQEPTFTVLHAFKGGLDGSNPFASLIQATDGNFYGTTPAGGTYSKGTVFKMTYNGAVYVLHSFTGGLDGASPIADLIQATDGNFYGTASSGGAYGHGTVFKMTPDGDVIGLHSFQGDLDGARPRAGLIEGADGNFYGTTQAGAGLLTSGSWTAWARSFGSRLPEKRRCFTRSQVA